MIINNITFQGKPGPNILAYARKEFGNEPCRIDRYVRLYSDTFSKSIDESTIVDISNDHKYVFSSTIFPNIEYISGIAINIKNSILSAILNECPKTMSKMEVSLYRRIISECIKRGMSIQDLSKMADCIKNDKSKSNFIENLDVAEQIIKENPNSQLSNQDFVDMLGILTEREANTPGTGLYNLIHNSGVGTIVYK